MTRNKKRSLLLASSESIIGLSEAQVSVMLSEQNRKLRSKKTDILSEDKLDYFQVSAVSDRVGSR